MARAVLNAEDEIDTDIDVGVEPAEPEELEPAAAALNLSGVMDAQRGSTSLVDFNLMMEVLFPAAQPAERFRLFVAALVSGKAKPLGPQDLAMATTIASRLDRLEIVAALSMVAAGFDPADAKFSSGLEALLSSSEKRASGIPVRR